MIQGGGHGGSAYGVKYQARCISALVGDLEQTCFLVGTLSLREDNEVHLIKYSSSSGDVTCEGLYPHTPEIWNLASCPFDPSIFSTVHSSAGEYGATVWKLPKHGSKSSQLERLSDLNGHSGKIKCTLWWRGDHKHNQMLSIDEDTLYIWDIDASGRSFQVKDKISPRMLHHMAGGAWDPHDVGNVATVSESCVQFWDLRSMKQTQTIEQAHAHYIDYNPKKQYLFATVSDDSGIYLWDKRMPGTSLSELAGHLHWTCQVQYNPACDEYLLSSGTDSLVNLWMVGDDHDSGVMSPNSSPRANVDPLLRSYNGHEDSVYGISWSLREPWIFASLSYDGRVLVESVPHNVAKHIRSSAKYIT